MSKLMQRDAQVIQAFREVAENDPGRIAVVSNGRELSFGEVMGRGAAIAGELRSSGVCPGVTVGAYLPRGLSLVPAVLGTWLAGGGYVPVDPDAPRGRAEYMLRDSGARVVLTGPGGLAHGITVPAAEIALDPTGSVMEVRRAAASAQASAAPAAAKLEDLAYIIYTSGTTGRPKGVLIGHAQVAAMAESFEKAIYSGAGTFPSRVAQNYAVTADSFFSDLVHLMRGRALYIVDNETRRDPERLAQFLLDNRIEVLDATPTQVRNIFLANRGEALAALTVLIVGGEPTAPDLWRQIRALPGVQAFNMYGPTECTAAVTVGSLGLHAEPVIGTAVEGSDVWVMDDQLRAVADGLPGELVITGCQVGLGYLNPSPADATKFVEVELPGTGRRVPGYRTGDRGYRNDDGQLVFLGRDDDQVNIGGHRVELGEIDVRIRECPGVLQAAVGMMDMGGSATLTAWIVLSGNAEADAVSAALAEELQPHMIPVLRVVPEIPMGPTGKADLSRLKASMTTAAIRQHVPEASPVRSQQLMTLIRGCWRQALGVENVNDNDDFFALGGDSLKATRVIMQLRSALDPALPIRILFENPRFADFSDAIDTWAQEQR